MVASGYWIDATKRSIWSTDGILYNVLAFPSRTYVVLVQYVNDFVTSMTFVLMTYMTITRKHITGNTNTTIKRSTVNQARGTAAKHAWKSIALLHVCHLLFAMVCCDALCDTFWPRVKWFIVSITYLCVWVEQISVITDHCGCGFPCFLFHLVYCSTGCYFDRWSSYVCKFYLTHQSSSTNVSLVLLRPAFVWIPLLFCDRCISSWWFARSWISGFLGSF